MRTKLFLSALLVALSTALSAAHTGTSSVLKQIAGMLVPVECSVPDISSTAINAANIAKTVVSSSNYLSELKSNAESAAKGNTILTFSQKLEMLQLAQQLLKNSNSQIKSVNSLMSKTKSFSSVINSIKDTQEREEALRSANYCTKLLGLCSNETKSQISTATQIIKILKAAK